MQKVLDDIKKLVEIPSVNQPAEDSMPFGKNIDLALDQALQMMAENGFKTFKDPEGYYGYAQLGEGEKVFGVLCHLDVVPEGNVNEWLKPPFTFHQDEENIYGRGVVDDKGPAVIALHALVDLIKEGYQLKMPIRFIFGTDEETDWRGINRYKENGELIPDFGIVPDSDFPVVYLEKTILQLDLISEQGSDINYKGGVAYNVVPGEAIVKEFDDVLSESLTEINARFEVTEEGLSVKGKNAHAAVAYEGHNALADLMSAYHLSGKKSPGAKLIYERLLGSPKGEKLLRETEDEVSGTMTVNLGMVDFTEDKERIQLDLRLPVSFNVEEVVNELNDVASEYGFQAELKSHLDGIHLPLESDFVQTLIASYRKVTGDQTEPMISGGGTYARAMENFISFGPGMPGTNYHIHEPNERISLNDVEAIYKIYQEGFKSILLEEK